MSTQANRRRVVGSCVVAERRTEVSRALRSRRKEMSYQTFLPASHGRPMRVGKKRVLVHNTRGHHCEPSPMKKGCTLGTDDVDMTHSSVKVRPSHFQELQNGGSKPAKGASRFQAEGLRTHASSVFVNPRSPGACSLKTSDLCLLTSAVTQQLVPGPPRLPP